MTLFIIGLKLFSFPMNEWLDIILHKVNPATQKIFLPGGLLFAAIGLLILKNYLKLKGSILDTVIWGLPLLGIVQRTGCLLNGCCYGMPANLPWSVHYPALSEPWHHHIESGLIQADASASLAVHPTQLYYIIGYIIVLLLLLKIGKSIKRPGNLALSGFLMLGILRFVIEFFREPNTGKWFHFIFFGINSIQWTILLVSIIAAIYLFKREKQIPASVPGSLQFKDFPFRRSLLLLLSTLLIWNARAILIFPEYFLLVLLLTICLLISIWEVLQKGVPLKFRYPVFIVFFIAVFTMSQTIPDTTLLLTPKNVVKKWISLDAGFSGGQYDRINYSCSGNETSRQSSAYSNWSTGIGFHHSDWKGNHVQAGLKFARMNDYTLQGDQVRYLTTTVAPFIKVDFRKIGFGGGYALQWGENRVGLPIIMLRLGNKDKFFFDANLMENYSLLGVPGIWQVGFGSSFGPSHQNLFRFGISSIEGKTIGYVSGAFDVTRNLGVVTNLGLGNTIHGSLGLQYRFNLKKE
ncbi:MAG: prolipoprotein diacylglyceryl transferase [Bacteroidales bacterium]|nr:prolipoprotein diacylglyceryl transferase [Bacteroidales bacterium]